MRSSLLTRAGSLAAAAVIATTGAVTVAGSAGAASAAGAVRTASVVHAVDAAPAHVWRLRRLPTHLSIARARAVEHRRHVTAIGGRLTSFRFRLGGKVVFLARVIARRGLIIVGREHTGRFGTVLFVVNPRLNAHYALIFPGTPRFHSSHSRVVWVRG